jgi:structural maintenance of chromosome 1
VTLQGTILHKSGLITGGQVPREDRETIGELDIQGNAVSIFSRGPRLILSSTALQKRRDAMLNQLAEYAKQKPKASEIAKLENELREAEANHRVLADQLVRRLARYLFHVDMRCKGFRESSSRGREKGTEACRRDYQQAEKGLEQGTNALVSKSPFANDVEQAQKAVDNQNAKVEELASQVNAADDEIFADFCRRIRVANIREYENVQLKAAQEENDALIKYKTQIARLEHQ